MSLYRVVARDLLREDEVRPFEQNDDDSGGLGVGGEPTAPVPVELESLDINTVGPYLLMLAAQEKAQEILTAANLAAEEIRRQAAEEGAAQGRQEAKRDLLPSATAFANAGQALIVFEEQLVSAYTPELVRLALEISEKLVGKTLVEDPQIVASVLERAKREVTNAREIRIWLNPLDHEMLCETCPQIVKCGDQPGRQIEVMTSPDVHRGGCLLETEIGVIDATMPTQMEEIHRQLLDEERKPKVDSPIGAT
jgi:flagellar biosynthesis/type III secretory pathway protein FliH